MCQSRHTQHLEMARGSISRSTCDGAGPYFVVFVLVVDIRCAWQCSSHQHAQWRVVRQGSDVDCGAEVDGQATRGLASRGLAHADGLGRNVKLADTLYTVHCPLTPHLLRCYVHGTIGWIATITSRTGHTINLTTTVSTPARPATDTSSRGSLTPEANACGTVHAQPTHSQYHT